MHCLCIVIYVTLVTSQVVFMESQPPTGSIELVYLPNMNSVDIFYDKLVGKYMGRT